MKTLRQHKWDGQKKQGATNVMQCVLLLKKAAGRGDATMQCDGGPGRMPARLAAQRPHRGPSQGTAAAAAARATHVMNPSTHTQAATHRATQAAGPFMFGEVPGEGGGGVRLRPTEQT